MLVEYVKDNYYARFHDPRYHRYRERHFTIFSVGRDVILCDFCAKIDFLA